MDKKAAPEVKFTSAETPSKRLPVRKIVIFTVVAVVLICSRGVGLGVGLPRYYSSADCPDTAVADTDFNPTFATQSSSSYNGWQPSAGDSWQIELLGSLTNTSSDVSVYDIDLFNNDATTIASLHAENRKVICYFSAGSYENWRPDKNAFEKGDCGNRLVGWKGEWWLNTKSDNVRKIMEDRLDKAKSKGCDGVDPDNVDAYVRFPPS